VLRNTCSIQSVRTALSIQWGPADCAVRSNHPSKARSLLTGSTQSRLRCPPGSRTAPSTEGPVYLRVMPLHLSGDRNLFYGLCSPCTLTLEAARTCQVQTASSSLMAASRLHVSPSCGALGPALPTISRTTPEAPLGGLRPSLIMPSRPVECLKERRICTWCTSQMRMRTRPTRNRKTKHRRDCIFYMQVSFTSPSWSRPRRNAASAHGASLRHELKWQRPVTTFAPCAESSTFVLLS
jgi:hypothetical protein